MQQKFTPFSPFKPQVKFCNSHRINNITISQWPKKAKPKRGNSTGYDENPPSAGCGRWSVHKFRKITLNLEKLCPIHRVLCDGWESTNLTSALFFVELAFLFLITARLQLCHNRNQINAGFSPCGMLFVDFA